MKKIFFCVSLVLTGLMSSCVDKYEEVDADSKPSWLGGSIYAELENPTKLSGTFNEYLRLIKDLGYAETLNRTGSKTIFPANDDAFKRFYQDNVWNVTCYEDLSESQKKLLLYSSMLDNALLIGLLPNATNGTGTPLKGQALKHETGVSNIDTVRHISSAAEMPKSNRFWTNYYKKGIDVVCDATTPMMVHLTREYMLNHDFKMTGDDNDFAILTGTPYTPGTAYIYNNRVIAADVTCQNGYIQQLENVLVPPGNMAEVIRNHSNTTLISRMLDYYAAPYYNATVTRYYNDWAVANGRAQIDSIFEMRYMSGRSQGEKLERTPQHVGAQVVSGSEILGYDPGWNGYYPEQAKAAAGDNLKDMGAFFVPDDEAVKKYFLPGGNGAYLIDIYGAHPGSGNTAENIAENLDSLHAKAPGVITSFLKNLMKKSFASTVPSKFATVTNDASENMGLNIGMLNSKGDGKYDITIANNGAVYVINTLIAPDEYEAVLAPSSTFPDMKIMDWAVKDATYLDVDFKYYLLAMSANYAFFVPEDSAFSCYYLDPASLGHVGPDGTTPRPDVLQFYYDHSAKAQPYLKCNRYYYNYETGAIEGQARPVGSVKEVASQLVDILNYHTLVLNSGEKIGNNHYYKTKHGGSIYVDGNVEGGRVGGEWQIKNTLFGRSLENDTTFRAPRIKKIHSQKNGHAYRMDRVIQAPVESVFAALNQDNEKTRKGEVNNNSTFSEFLSVCNYFSVDYLLSWAGISNEEKKDANGNKLGYTEQDAFIVFTRNYKMGSTSISDACPDYNVKMFNTYNYTLFAPDNAAMEKAYQNGLPRWTDILSLYRKYYPEEEGATPVGGNEDADKATAYNMICQLRDFVRYHFMTNSFFADNTVEGGRNLTLSSDETGVAKELMISGGNNTLQVKDAAKTVTISATDGSKMVNKMTRDYWYDASKKSAKAIKTSSFCTIHQISEPLCSNANGRFDQ